MNYDFVRNYRNIDIEPRGYELAEGIPIQPSLFSVYTQVDVKTEEVLEELGLELYELLPEHIAYALDETGCAGGSEDDLVYNDERLSFIQIPDPGELTNRSMMGVWISNGTSPDSILT